MTESAETSGDGYATLSAIHGIIDERSHSFLGMSNKHTLEKLGEKWTANMRKNHENKMWKKHGSLFDACAGMSSNKAFIGVGAGPSLKKNIGVLKYIHDTDGTKPWHLRNFLICVSNHHFKPLLEMGIVPDFVTLVDASDVVYNQLCVNIPHHGQSTTLIAPFHASPRVLKKWAKQGRAIKFFTASAESMRTPFKEITGIDAERHFLHSGGNVLNTMWMYSAKIMGACVFICMGNDLSFPVKANKKEQEDGYYADGDYSTNAKVTGTGRDEAACEKKWLAFSIKKRNIFVQGQNEFEIIGKDIVGTSHTLWVYKTWMEEAMVLMTKLSPKLGLHYYNCTEGGILGVMSKSTESSDMKTDDNWFMMDDVCHRWHTTTLEHAASQYLQAKAKVREEKSGGIIYDRSPQLCTT